MFCRIIRGELPAFVLAQTNDLIVFVSKNNHPMVVPKRHAPDIYTLDEATAAAILPMAKRVARALKAALACEGVYLTQANEPAAGQDVFHFHLHVYPRWHNVPFQTQQMSGEVTVAERQATLDRLLAVW